MFRFPLDGKVFPTKAKMYAYIEETYPNMINEDMPPARLYFNLKYNKTEGRSVISGKPTKWNNVTERYERFANEEERKEYVRIFKERMQKKYGKVHLLDDPEHQKKMLGNRSIGIPYKWKDGRVSHVTGKYEETFLGFLEGVYNFTPDMLNEPPTIYYKDGDNTRFYLPDFFIPSLNLIIEVKGSNKHYQERDAYKEELKAKATKDAGFEFIQIQDHHFSEFHAFFKKMVIDK